MAARRRYGSRGRSAASRRHDLPTLAHHTGLPSWPSSVNFMPLGSGSGSGRGGEKNDVVAVDYSGSGVLYRAASRAVTILPPMNTPKAFPVSLTIGGNIYVMERYPASSQSPSSCFEVLVHDRHPNHPFATPHWHWRLLPSPPFAFTADDALDSIRNFFQDDDDFLTAYTRRRRLMHLDDSAEHRRRRPRGLTPLTRPPPHGPSLGDWLLPFRGRAEYAPEHKLWFALSSDGNELCASDLAAAAQCVEGEPRVAQRLTGDAAPRPSRRRQVLHCQIHVQRVEVQL
ncbi:hypothetical protein OsJ_09692 [Oryza sativa Japonica Group]|uniref:Uncharacterized protein n=1 Tax=Oryza sativa subsp. japonica TaxID=39947 RepID=A3AEW3_ORYSJ|nr:hypothetical protein OsJ_09692 [Oryza sativa Japonica Group]